MTSAHEQRQHEREAYGISYDRFALTRLQRVLTRELGVSSVLECPSHGAKAAGSLYSLGWALAGCDVTLVNPDPDPLHYWDELNLRDQLMTAPVDDPAALPFKDDNFDLCFNFVTFTGLADPDAWLEEMKRVSRRHVMVVACNNFQLGYPLHRALHALFNIPWNHGDVSFNYPWAIKRWFKRHGLKITGAGTTDSPPWPDPVGFRDVRLHRQYAGEAIPEQAAHWEVPMVEMLKKNKFPLWMRLLGLYDLPLRKGYIKLPVSHLFWVVGEL